MKSVAVCLILSIAFANAGFLGSKNKETAVPKATPQSQLEEVNYFKTHIQIFSHPLYYKIKIIFFLYSAP